MVSLAYRRLGAGPQLAGVLLVLLSCISLQVGAALAVQLFPIMGAWAVSFLRLSVAALFLLLLARPRVRAWTRQQWLAVLLFGASLGAMNTTFYLAIDLIPLGLAVAVEFAGPLLLASFLSRSRLDALWIVLSALGLALLGWEAAHDESIIWQGIWLALLAGVFWALYIVTSSRAGRRLPGNEGLAGALAVAALLSAPLGAPTALTSLTDVKIVFLAIATGLVASVIPYLAEFAALRRLPEHVFSILLSLEPVVAALAGLIMLGQYSGPLRWAAIFLLVAASIGITVSSRSQVGQRVDRVEQLPPASAPS